MVDYKKQYAFLVGEIDRALHIMDTGNLLEYGHVKEILQSALLKAEDNIINDMDEEEGE